MEITFILCTGGLSYPKTGSSGEGLTYARGLGHNIIKPRPSLVPIEVEEAMDYGFTGSFSKKCRIKDY